MGEACHKWRQQIATQTLSGIEPAAFADCYSSHTTAARPVPVITTVYGSAIQIMRP
jgi:hypothetical protein